MNININFIWIYLKKNKIECVVTREPGGTKFGESIRDILLDSKSNLDSTSEAVFTLPDGLTPSSDLRIELEMSRSLFDTSDTFVWEGFSNEGGAWQLSRDEVNTINTTKSPATAINLFTGQIVLVTDGLLLSLIHI